MEYREPSIPFFCKKIFVPTDNSHLLNPQLQSLLYNEDINCEILTRLELMKEYFESLDEFTQNLLISYKKTLYNFTTPAFAQYMKLRPEEKIKKIIDRNYKSIQKNEEYRKTLLENHPEITKVNTRYILADSNIADKEIQTLINKPDILFILNKSIVNAPFFPKKPLKLYRGERDGRFTEFFYRMKVGDIHSREYVASTSSKPDGAATFISFHDIDYYAPVLLIFNLNESYPRLDLIYMEGCEARNDESEYLLPVVLKKTSSNINTNIFRNNEDNYVKAKWKCTKRTIEKITDVFHGRARIDQRFMTFSHLKTDLRAAALIARDPADPEDIEKNQNNMVVLEFEPYIEEGEPSEKQKLEQQLWNRSFRATSQKEIKSEANMDYKRKLLMNELKRKYMATQKRKNMNVRPLPIRTDPFIRAIAQHGLNTRKNK